MKRFNAKNPNMVGRTKVLVLEDDVCLQEIICRTLQTVDRNAEIYWATTLEEAFADIGKHAQGSGRPYNLILADIFLSGESTGIDFWRMCQNKIPAVPFLLTSSISTEQYAAMIDRYGIAPPFLPKPFSPETWQHAIKRYLLVDSGPAANNRRG